MRLLWHSVEDRLGEGRRLTIKAGWKIAELAPKEEEECSCFGCQLKRSLMGGDGGIIVGFGMN